jgi:hypothetical protein
MPKMIWLAAAAALLTSVGLIEPPTRAAELEGALQYPPASVGEDVQPPPPARMVPQPLSPRRIELGVGGSSMPPGTQKFHVHAPLRQDGRGAPPGTGNGG